MKPEQNQNITAIVRREPFACGHDVCLDRGVTTCMFRPMCNDGDCPMADFPHDPHPASSGSYSETES